MIRLRQEQARQLAEPRSCWETLAQPFEPDLTLQRLQELFAPLRKRLPELLRKAGGDPRQRELSWDLSETAQQQLCNKLLRSWGRDESITCVALSSSVFDHARSKRLQNHDKSCAWPTALLLLGHSA